MPEVDTADIKPKIVIFRVVELLTESVNDSFHVLCMTCSMASNSDVCDISFYRKYKYDGCETGSSCISDYSTGRGEIPKTVLIFLRTACPTL